MPPPAVEESKIALEAFGVRIGVRVAAPGYRFEDLPALPPGSVEIPWERLDVVYRQEWRDEEASPYRLTGYHWMEDDKARRYATTIEQGMRYLESLLEHHVAEHARGYLFVHAGVVTWRGMAIVLPGESFSGKSTLVRALVEAGAAYYSDEFAVFDEQARVFTYPRHVSQRGGPFGPAGRIDLGHLVPAGAWRDVHAEVGLIALLRFEPEGAWRTEPLAPAAAMMAMSQHVVAIRRRPADAFAVLHQVVEPAAVVEGVRGDAAVAAHRMLAAIDAGAGAAEFERAEVIATLLAGV